MSQEEFPNPGPNPEDGVARRKTVRLGRRFAGSIATRLDAHRPSEDTDRLEDERKILDLMRDVLMLAQPDPVAVSFITHAVEVHTQKFGFSQKIYDELFRLHQARLRRPAPEAAPTSRHSAASRPSPAQRPAPQPARAALPKPPERPHLRAAGPKLQVAGNSLSLIPRALKA